MKEALSIEAERVDDIPLLIAYMQHMNLAGLLDKHFPVHGNRRGLSLGGVSMVWLTHLLSQADHRMNRVQEWATRRLETLHGCGVNTLEPGDLTDDRLADVLRALSGDVHWQAFEQELMGQLVRVYDLQAQGVRIGEIVVAELGTGVDRFPTEAHLVSRVGLCPAAKISAGKRLSAKTGKGNCWLRQTLMEAAQAAARSKGTYLGAYYQRLRKRMGHKKAIVALAHRILVIIYHLLEEQQSYRELGPGHAEEQANDASKCWAIRRLEELGYQVTLQSAEVA